MVKLTLVILFAVGWAATTRPVVLGSNPCRYFCKNQNNWLEFEGRFKCKKRSLSYWVWKNNLVLVRALANKNPLNIRVCTMSPSSLSSYIFFYYVNSHYCWFSVDRGRLGWRYFIRIKLLSSVQSLGYGLLEKLLIISMSYEALNKT